jgi:purine-binding chemotaxis protein CheW
MSLLGDARPLAARPPEPGLDGRCFTVTVERETFGLPVSNVQTIFRIEAVTAVPLGPREILGLVNLRGKIVTAVSLRRRLSMPDRDSEGGILAIGIEHRGEDFALVVDEVGDVIDLDADTLVALPPHLSAERARLTATVHRLSTGILPVLSMDAVFEFQRRKPGMSSGIAATVAAGGVS